MTFTNSLQLNKVMNVVTMDTVSVVMVSMDENALDVKGHKGRPILCLLAYFNLMVLVLKPMKAKKAGQYGETVVLSLHIGGGHAHEGTET